VERASMRRARRRTPIRSRSCNATAVMHSWTAKHIKSVWFANLLKFKVPMRIIWYGPIWLWMAILFYFYWIGLCKCFGYYLCYVDWISTWYEIRLIECSVTSFHESTILLFMTAQLYQIIYSLPDCKNRLHSSWLSFKVKGNVARW
jgi:hypothetical protein